MRTTINLEDDVAKAVRHLAREEGLGVSEAVNRLARAGLTVKAQRTPFRQRSLDIGLKVDVSDVAEVLEVLEGPEHR